MRLSMYEMDHQIELEDAKSAGIKRGLAEGKQQGIKNLVVSLKQQGIQSSSAISLLMATFNLDEVTAAKYFKQYSDK